MYYFLSFRGGSQKAAFTTVKSPDEELAESVSLKSAAGASLTKTRSQSKTDGIDDAEKSNVSSKISTFKNKHFVE